MENEEPKPRVALSIPDATLILQRHGLGLNCTDIKYLDRGSSWRNSSYIITSSEGKEFFLRFSLTWPAKSENERAAISLLRAHCPSLPVPEVFGFQNNFEVQGDKEKFDYIIFQKLPGLPLADVFKSFSLSDKKKIVTSLVNILFQLRQIAFDKIGSFKFISGSEGEVEVGEDFNLKAGPFDCFDDYAKAYVNHEVVELSKCPFLLEGLDFEGLKKEIAKFLERYCGAKHSDTVPFLFTHMDFHAYNLLVDKESKEITGLIDFEWSGAYPTDKEWYGCCSFLGVGTSYSNYLSKSPKIPDCLSCESLEELKDLYAFFFDECSRIGVRTPHRAGTPLKIWGFNMRTRFQSLAENICPWWVREGMERRNMTKEELLKERGKSREKVFKMLGIWEKK